MRRRPVILIAERAFSHRARRILARVGRVIDFGSRKQFLKNLPRAEVIVNALEVKLHRSLLGRAPRLTLVGSRTTQLRYINLRECRRRGIAVVNIKGNSPVLRRTPSTAEETMALLLALVRKTPWAFDAIKRGEWERKKYGGNELFSKTIGLIGFGRLGRMVARYARAFGMHVIACDPYVGGARMRRAGVRKVSLPFLLRHADIVSVHAVYNDETEGMLGRKHFRMMKPTAVFINTARGEITNEQDLLRALQRKWIAGAAIDTLAGETPDGSHLKHSKLVTYAVQHQKLIIVPHLGGATREATERTQIYISELVRDELMKMKVR